MEYAKNIYNNVEGYSFDKVIRLFPRFFMRIQHYYNQIKSKELFTEYSKIQSYAAIPLKLAVNRLVATTKLDENVSQTIMDALGSLYNANMDDATYKEYKQELRTEIKSHLNNMITQDKLTVLEVDKLMHNLQTSKIRDVKLIDEYMRISQSVKNICTTRIDNYKKFIPIVDNFGDI